jgi:hypothetical protein
VVGEEGGKEVIMDLVTIGFSVTLLVLWIVGLVIERKKL